MPVNYMRNRGGEPPRASQRRQRTAPATPPAAFAPGDRVRWNGRYEGTVKRVCANTALVEEAEILGRRATWRLDLAALSLAPVRP